MPYTWTDAPVFLEHAGVKIYRVYKSDDYDNGCVRTYWYGLTPDVSDDGQDEFNAPFDVRDLGCWVDPDLSRFASGDFAGKEEAELDAIKQTLILAIDGGELKPNPEYTHGYAPPVRLPLEIMENKALHEAVVVDQESDEGTRQIIYQGTKEVARWLIAKCNS